ncbi:MAG: hypothetical protein K0S47_1060 [Herbinix sp.]|jgi:hypothetical protein|nr:hypothetical protein [Herbinix sp.]
MRFTRIRIFLVNQYEKEEKWLNEMAAKGFAMVSIRGGICYEFESCNPGEYIYRLELLENNITSPESLHYIKFVEETGAVMIGTWFRWVYFRKKASEGEFMLFSDIASKVTHYQRIRRIIIPVLFLEGFITLTNFHYYIGKVKDSYQLGSVMNMDIFCAILLGMIDLILIYLSLSLTWHIRKLKREQIIRE